jgi:hypothetical protein
MSMSRHRRTVIPVLCIAFPSSSKNAFTLPHSRRSSSCAVFLRARLSPVRALASWQRGRGTTTIATPSDSRWVHRSATAHRSARAQRYCAPTTNKCAAQENVQGRRTAHPWPERECWCDADHIVVETEGRRLPPSPLRAVDCASHGGAVPSGGGAQGV